MKRVIYLSFLLLTTFLGSLTAQVITTGPDITFGNMGHAPKPFSGSVDCFTTRVFHSKIDNKIYTLTQKPSTTTNYSQMAVTRYNMNGSLDGTYGTNGTFEYYLDSVYSQPFNIVQQSDGKILFGYYWEDNFNNYSYLAAVRLNNNGQLDNSYNNDGVYDSIIIENDAYFQSGNLKIDSNDNLFIGGGLYNFNSFISQITIAKVTSNAVLDNSFSGDGIYELVNSNIDYYTNNFIILPNGNIILAINFYDNSTFTDGYFLKALTSSGTDLNSFGVNSVLNINLPGLVYGDAGFVLHNNALYFGTYFSPNLSNNAGLGVLKLDPNTGATDMSYGINGIGLAFDPNNLNDIFPQTMVMDTLGRCIVGIGYYSPPVQQNFAGVVRLNANGIPDVDFMNTGIHISSIPGFNNVVVDVQPDLKVLLGCTRTIINVDSCILYRFNNIKLKLTSPVGGEFWIPSTAYNITWESENVNNVNLQYSNNGGITWNPIANNLPASSGAYNWITPAINGFAYRVRIQDATQPTVVYDTSDVNFTISNPAVSVLYPNGGEFLNVLATVPINWGSVAVSNVDIAYSANGGSTWTNIATNVPSVNGVSNSYNWTTPITPGTAYRVRIQATGNTSIADVSDANFTIQNPITVISPNGGEAWSTNTNYPITWNAAPSITNVRISYSSNNGSTWTTIVPSTPAATGSYNWLTPNIQSSNYLIRIESTTNTALKDESDGVFTLATPPSSLKLITPNGGEYWLYNASYAITWTGVNVSTVNLYYSLNGTTWTSIASNLPFAPSTYSWTMPNIISGNYLVKVEKANDPNVYDASDFNFEVGYPTSISTTLSSQGFKLYPNPSTHHIYINSIDASKKQVSVTGQLGQVVYTSEFTNTITIPVANLSAGNYIVNIASNGKVYSQQITKQ
jgi:uncharacterized delta-60 repeat protein